MQVLLESISIEFPTSARFARFSRPSRRAQRPSVFSLHSVGSRANRSICIGSMSIANRIVHGAEGRFATRSIRTVPRGTNRYLIASLARTHVHVHVRAARARNTCHVLAPTTTHTRGIPIRTRENAPDSRAGSFISSSLSLFAFVPWHGRPRKKSGGTRNEQR